MALTGHLELEAVPAAGGKTVIARQSFSAPFHVGKAYWDERVLRLQVVNPTAGMLEGDEMRMSVAVERGASLALSTPAASRSFSMAGGGQARLVQELRVAEGAYLEYAPEPLYPHVGTNFEQRTRIELARGGGLFFADSLAPGRAARGELWRWKRLVMALDVSRERIPLFRERLDLGGSELGEMARFHGREEAWFATVLLASPTLAGGEEWSRKISALQTGATACACTRVAEDLFVCRLVAPGGQALRDAMAALRAVLAGYLPGMGGLRRGS